MVELAKFLEDKMSVLLVSSDLEVQERASSVLQVLAFVLRQMEQQQPSQDQEELLE